MRRNSLFRLLAMTSAMVIGLMSANRAFAEGSVYIKANLTDVKIGDLYYDLNTKTHKAAVVYQHDPSGVLTNYNDLTSVDIPSTVKFLNPTNHYIEEEFTVVEIGTHAFANCPKLEHISIPSSIVYIGMDMVQYRETSTSGQAEYKRQYLEKNPSGYVGEGYYIDDCLVGTTTEKEYWSMINPLTSRLDNYQGWIHKKLETLKVKEGTRVVAANIINAENIFFPEGKIILSGDVVSYPWHNHAYKIIEACCAGLLGKEIADKFHISLRAVNSHKTNIFNKLGISSSVEMVRFALEHGII